MAKINKGEVIREITEGCRIDTAIEPAPSELGKTVVPVFVANQTGRIRAIFDGSLNSSVKNFTVPTGKRWEILYISVKFVTSAQTGNRTLEVRLTDPSGNFFFRGTSEQVQAASGTTVYNFLPGISDAASAGARVMIPLPVQCILPQNFVLTIVDNATIDVSVDDMSVHILLKEFEIEDRET